MTRKTTSFASDLLEGAREAAEIARGNRKAARVTRRAMTSGKVSISSPPRFDGRRIRRVRHAIGLSQPMFAACMNVSDATVRAWEQGKRRPEGASLRLLELAESKPKSFIEIAGLEKARPKGRAGAA